MPMRTHDYNNGFTLIEMLVAVAISSVILLMVYTAYSSIIKTVNYGKKVSSYYQQLNTVLHRIDSDITDMYWKDNIKNLKMICEFDGKSSSMNFVTSEYHDYRIILQSDGQYPSSDIHETGYYLKKSTDENMSLIRKTDINYNESFSEGGYEEELLTNVISLKFEFNYRSDWTEKWDTTEKKRLPAAVRTTLEVVDPFNKIEKYQIISLPGLAYE